MLTLVCDEEVTIVPVFKLIDTKSYVLRKVTARSSDQ